MNDTHVGIGVIGAGTVGAAFIELLAERASVIAARTGLALSIDRVAVRDLQSPRSFVIDPAVFTDDAASVAVDPSIDLVVEVMGGVEPARALVLAALGAGKPVVTANKALVAAHGPELFAAAEAAGVDLLFEAAIGGGIPFVRPLRESLLAEPIDLVIGIVNGTTNYILTQMCEHGADYRDALAEAQALGYAEADPSADVDGHDAAAKIAIAASIAFGARVSVDDVECEGIAGLSVDDIVFAARHGYTVKLLAIAQRFDGPEGPRLSARVHPSLVPLDHPLASVRDSFNAVFVHGSAVGDLMFYGPGAGGSATASAVLGDVVDAAVNLRRGAHGSIGALAEIAMQPTELLSSAHHLSIHVDDRPGVLAAIATVFGEHGVSIDSMEQGAGTEGDDSEARLDLITHPTTESEMQVTIESLRSLDVVRRVGRTIRVLDEEIR